MQPKSSQAINTLRIKNEIWKRKTEVISQCYWTQWKTLNRKTDVPITEPNTRKAIKKFGYTMKCFQESVNIRIFLSTNPEIKDSWFRQFTVTPVISLILASWMSSDQTMENCQRVLLASLGAIYFVRALEATKSQDRNFRRNFCFKERTSYRQERVEILFTKTEMRLALGVSCWQTWGHFLRICVCHLIRYKY